MDQQHEMVLENTHPSGAEEWYCPTCGRRFLMQWPPAYEMIVLEPGDQYAQHSGGKGGLRIGGLQVEQENAESDDVSEERLRPWIKALENLDLNW
jgi:hypothetical protein